MYSKGGLRCEVKKWNKIARPTTKLNKKKLLFTFSDFTK